MAEHPLYRLHRRAGRHGQAGGSVAQAADVRNSERLDFHEEAGRVPSADECRLAVQKTQLALAEIEQRRAVEQRRVAYEERERQLNRWVAEDALEAQATAEAADTQARAG